MVRRETLSFSICSQVFDYSYLFSWMNCVACATTFAFSFGSCLSMVREIVHAAVNDNDLPTGGKDTAHTRAHRIRSIETRARERTTGRVFLLPFHFFFLIGASLFSATNEKGRRREGGEEKTGGKETAAAAFSPKRKKRIVADKYAENKGKID